MSLSPKALLQRNAGSMLTPIPLSGPLLEDQTPRTPPRSHRYQVDDDGILQYGGMPFTSGGLHQNGQNTLRSPLNWPPPTSPIHTYAGFGQARTPLHGFGLSSAAIGDGRLSMGQFEFGVDGELTFTNTEGPATAQPVAVEQECLDTQIKQTLGSARDMLGFGEMDTSKLEKRMQTQCAKLSKSPGPLLAGLPLHCLEQSNKVAMTSKHVKEEPNGKQKTLTDGGRCRSKRVKLDDPVPLKGAASKVDMANATPEMRFQRIQSLYAEFQRSQDAAYLMQASIKQRDDQIASLTKDNSSLWSMVAHIATVLQMALIHEAHIHRKVTTTPTQPAQRKRRRSSQGCYVDKENAQVNTTPDVTKLGGDEIMELENLFNSPATKELLASCNMLPSPIPAPQVTAQHEAPAMQSLAGGLSSQYAKTPAKLPFPPLPWTNDPPPFGNYNPPGTHTTTTFNLDDDVQKSPLNPRHEGADKENSFSFQNL